MSRLIQDLKRQGQLAAALQTAEQALADNPDDAALQVERADLLARLNRPQEALQVLDDLPQLNLYGQALKAGLLEHNHQAEEAADLFEQLANQPHLPPAVLRRVVRHLQAKDPQRAAHLAARHEQQNPEASLLAAQALHKGGQTEEALRALEAAHAAYPAHPGIFALLAELRLSQEPPEVVAEELQNLLSLAEHGPNLALRERLVQALRDSGQLQKAEAELWTCLQQAPNPHYFRANLAYVWRDLGRIDEALGLMEELLEENPNDRFVLNAYCKTCRDHDRAERGGGFIGLQAARDARLKRWWGTWKKVWGAAPE